MNPKPNSEQVAVIEHPAEPLRVAAGAGTGKTTTIVQRLASAVTAGMAPEAALGITFTNKAAEQLADRLRDALPDLSREGREVEVATYHGFAYSILREFGAFVGIERTAKVVGPGYVRQLLLESLPGRTYEALDLTAPDRRVEDAAMLAAALGDNLLDTHDLTAAAPQPPDDVWKARLELAEVVAAYESTKARLNVVDYADLVRGAYTLLRDHPAIAARIRDRYQMVLLDEYQDTAPAQREMLRMLFGDGLAVTAVGDTDQTIYEWRGASRANFDAFPEHFRLSSGESSATLPLTINYRSASAIVASANAIRAEIHGDDAFDPLVALRDAPEGAVECRWLRTAADEATWIASEIRRRHDEENERWDSMAVLFRKNRLITVVRDALQDAGIPVEVASLGGLLDVPEVADLHAWLSIIEHPEDPVPLVRILLGSSYHLGFADLAPLMRWNLTEAAAERGSGTPQPLLTAIEELESVSGLTTETRRRLDEFRSSYRRLVVQAQTVALVELCRRVLDEIDAWVEIDAMDEARELSARLNLYRFLDLAQDWSPLEGRPSLAAFLGYLSLLRDETSSDELDTARVGGEDAVTLLTVHRAKGLEWDTVFVPAVTKGGFPASSSRYDDPAAVAASLPYAMRLDAATLPSLGSGVRDRKALLRQRHLESEWRTAYVAITRARSHLYVSGAFWYGGKTARVPSPLFELVAGQPAVSVQLTTKEPGPEPQLAEVAGSPIPAPDPLFAGGWKQALRRAHDPAWVKGHIGSDRATYDAEVKQLQMMLDGLPEPPIAGAAEPVPGTSVTGLVTLESCPQRFYWSEVERLPRRPAPALRRGVEIHRRIELHNLGRIAFDDLDPVAYDAIEGEPTDTTSAFEVFLASRFANMRPRFIETPIDIRVGDYRIRGRVDAIYEPEPGVWEIVDYKSGRNRDDPAALVQLEAYAIAAASGAIGGSRPDSLLVSFLYLGGGTATEVGYEVDAAWLEGAEAHIQALANQVGGTEFAPTPSRACRSCDFVSFCDEGSEFVAQAETPPDAAVNPTPV